MIVKILAIYNTAIGFFGILAVPYLFFYFISGQFAFNYRTILIFCIIIITILRAVFGVGLFWHRNWARIGLISMLVIGPIIIATIISESNLLKAFQATSTVATQLIGIGLTETVIHVMLLCKVKEIQKLFK